MSNAVRLADLQISKFSNLGSKIDLYNKKAAGNASLQERLRSSTPTNTFMAYTQSLGTDERATQEGYNRFLSQTAHGYEGCTSAIKQFNAMQAQGTDQQNAYAQAIGTGNAHLGNYLTNLNGGTATMRGYIGSLVKAKVATIGLQAASMALNMALVAGIGWIVSFGISKISEWARATEIASEKAKGFANSVNQAFGDVSKHSKTLSELNKEYQTLSKGVNSLGINTGLSADQYDRYKEIISQVSDIMPNLAAHFNAQGEKIGFVKGQLSDLNNEYEKYIQKQAQKFLVDGDEDGNKFSDTLKDYQNNNRIGFWKGFANSFEAFFGTMETDDFATSYIKQEFERLQNMSKNELVKALTFDSINDPMAIWDTDISRTHKATKNTIIKMLGVDNEYLSNLTDEEFNSLKEKILSQIQLLQSDIDSDMSNITSGLTQMVYSKDSFWKIKDNAIRDNITTFMSSLTSDIWDNLNLESENDISVFVNDIIKKMSDKNGEFAKAWNGLFDLQDNQDISANDYVNKAKEFIDTIGKSLGLNENGKQEFLLSLGFDIDTSNATIEQVKSKLQDQFDNKAGTLSLGDLQVAANLEIPDGTLLSWDELIQKINEAKAATAGEQKIGISDEQSKKIDDFQSKLSSLSDTMLKFQQGKLTATDKIDLIQEFPELAEHTEQLDHAISELAKGNLDELINLLGDNIPDGLADSLREAMEESLNAYTSFEKLSSELDGLQSAYKTVSDAIDEYSKNGAWSIDTVQALFEMDSRYFGLLIDESGGLTLTKEKLQELTKARIEDLAVSRLRQLIEDVERNGENAVSLQNLSLATDEATGSQWSFYYAQIASLPVSDAVKQKIYEQADAYRNLADAAQQSAGNNFDFAMTGSNGGKSAKDIAKEMKELLQEKALNQLKYGIDKVKEALQETDDVIETINDHLDLTYEQDYMERLLLNAEKLDLVRQQGKALREEFERLAATQPSTAAEAQELQSRMEELGEQISQNIQDVRKYTLELTQLRVDALVETGNAATERLKHGMNTITNSIQALSGQSLMGFNFNFMPVIPKDVVEQQRQINDRLIAEEKRYQEEIWKIRKKYIDLDKKEKDAEIAERMSELRGSGSSGSFSSGSIGSSSGGSYSGSSSGNAGTNRRNVQRVDIKIGEDETSKLGHQAVEKAMDYLGTPYVWGGTTPNGFDCSGLVQYVYKQLGKEITRTTYSQWDNSDLKDVTYDSLKEGDLMYFAKNGDIHHVAMYVGDGKMLHAPSTGDFVKVQEITDYYKNQFVGAKRIFDAESYDPSALKKTISEAVTDAVPKVKSYNERVANDYEKQAFAYNASKGHPMSYEKYNPNWNSDSMQYQYHSKVNNGDSFIDDNGFMRQKDGRYVVATKGTYGKVGDYLNVKLKDGTVIPIVIGDEKGMENAGSAFADIVHNDGSIIEFLVDQGKYESVNGKGRGVQSVISEFNQDIESITNLGQNYLENGLIPLIDAIEENTQAQQDNTNATTNNTKSSEYTMVAAESTQQPGYDKKAHEETLESGRGYEVDGVTPIGAKKSNITKEDIEKAEKAAEKTFTELVGKFPLDDNKSFGDLEVKLTVDGKPAKQGVDYDIVDSKTGKVLNITPEEAYNAWSSDDGYKGFAVRPHKDNVEVVVQDKLDLSPEATKKLENAAETIKDGVESGRGYEPDGVTPVGARTMTKGEQDRNNVRKHNQWNNESAVNSGYDNNLKNKKAQENKLENERGLEEDGITPIKDKVDTVIDLHKQETKTLFDSLQYMKGFDNHLQNIQDQEVKLANGRGLNPDGTPISDNPIPTPTSYVKPRDDVSSKYHLTPSETNKNFISNLLATDDGQRKRNSTSSSVKKSQKDIQKSNDNLKDDVNKNTSSIFDLIRGGLKDTGTNVDTTNKGIKDSVASTASWCKANPITITTNHVDTYTTVGSPSSGGGGSSSSGNSGGNKSGSSKSSGGNKSSGGGNKVNRSKSGTTGNVTLDAQLRATDAGQRARNGSASKVYKPEVKITWSKRAKGTDENGLPTDETAIVGELGTEGAILPDGTAVELHKGLAQLPKGTQILTAKQYAETKKYEGRFLGQKIPRYASGTNSAKSYDGLPGMSLEEWSKNAGKKTTGSTDDDKAIKKFLSEREKQEKERTEKQEKYLTKFDMYIQETLDKVQKYSEEELKTWREIDAKKYPIIEKSETGLQKIRDMGGTTKAGQFAEDFTVEMREATHGLLKETMKWQKSNMLRQFEQQSDILNKMYEYYDERAKADDVTADELEILRKGIVEQQEAMQDLSDAYVEAAQQLKDFVIDEFENAQLRFSAIDSFLDKDLRKLDRQLQNAVTYTEKEDIYKQQAAKQGEKVKTYQAQKEHAHQTRLKTQQDLMSGEDGETYKKIFDTFNIEAWYDADGNHTNQFKDDMVKVSELVSGTTVNMNLIDGMMSEFKKTYAEVEEAEANALQDQMNIIRQAEDARIETYLTAQKKQSDLYTFVYNRQQSIIDGLQSEYSLRQQIRQTISDANNELRANKDLAEWLDDDTRKLLFNEDDYSSLVKTCNGINKEISKLYKNYKSEISKLDSNNWFEQERLTAAFNRQLEIQKEQLELANKELNIAKKQAEYDNRAKERDTQIVLGNRIVNVANPEELYKIAQEKAQLESDYENTLTTNAENQDVRDMQALNDKTKEQAAAIQNNIDMWNSMTDEQRRAMSKFLPITEELQAVISSLSTTDIPMIRENIVKLFENAFTDLHLKPNMGWGTDISVDYSLIEQGITDAIEKGVVSTDFGKKMLTELDDAREQKRAFDHDFLQYLPMFNGGKILTPSEYSTQIEKQDRAELKAKNISENRDTLNEIKKIEDVIKANNGVATISQLEDLKRLQTIYNKQIFENGLNDKQSDRWGAQTFSDYIEGNFQASINALIDRVENRTVRRGIYSDNEKADLADYETRRNYKIWSEGLDMPQTTDHNGKTFDVVNPENFQETLDLIREIAKKDGWTDKSKQAANEIETARNYKIIAEGLNAKQTNENQGFIFSKEQTDYKAAMDKLRAMADKYGWTDQAKELMTYWEDARNKKLAKKGNTADQTNEWNAKKYTRSDDGQVVESKQNNTKATAKTVEELNTEAADSLKTKIENGEYVVLEPQNMVLNITDKDAFQALQNGNVDIAKNYLNSLVGLVPQQNANTQSINYTLTGDIILTEKITNGNEFIQSLTNGINSQYPIIKNTKN